MVGTQAGEVCWLAFQPRFAARVSAGRAGRRAARWNLQPRFLCFSCKTRTRSQRDPEDHLPRCYQANRNPNCAARPSSAVVMIPAVVLEMFASGLPKLL